jgi:hypothetical protein
MSAGLLRPDCEPCEIAIPVPPIALAFAPVEIRLSPLVACSIVAVINESVTNFVIVFIIYLSFV